MKQLLTAAFCLLVLASVSSTELGYRSGDDDDPTSINAVVTSVLHKLAVVTQNQEEAASEVKELRQTMTRLAQRMDKLEKRDVEVSD